LTTFLKTPRIIQSRGSSRILNLKFTKQTPVSQVLHNSAVPETAQAVHCLKIFKIVVSAGGESIYGGYFPDEFHSRLRFKHRGLVASANAGEPNTNNSQFFVTLDRCDWLDKKNTIFGKVHTSRIAFWLVRNVFVTMHLSANLQRLQKSHIVQKFWKQPMGQL
jgi:hypothetical protein